MVVVCEVAAGTHGIGGVAHDPGELDRSLRSIAKAIADLAATRLAEMADMRGGPSAIADAMESLLGYAERLRPYVIDSALLPLWYFRRRGWL